MRIQEDWRDLMYSLTCLQKGSAKRQFRQFIKYSFGGLCAYCRTERATTVDHLKPRSKGGSDLRSNLVPCCVDCNHSKGSLDFEEWFTTQEFYNKVAHELIDEWVTNNRNYEEYEDEQTIDRTAVCSNKGTLRGGAHEPTCA